MKKHVTAVAFVAAAAVLLLTLSALDADTQTTAEAPRVSGPYTHENLSIYLIHGKGAPLTDRLLSLSEALEQKKVIVYETGDVNLLTVENRSDVPVYIQAGDIVRGGKQDRTLGDDMVLAPRSGKVEVASFCVEAGRWRPRGNEASGNFAVSQNTLSSKRLKVAAKQQNSQADVWSEVASSQAKLRTNVGAPVEDQSSPSSLELTLENKQLKAKSEAYVAALSPFAEKNPDAIGFAFAVNGVLNSADVYASHDFFMKNWARLLKATVTEAIAEITTARSPQPPSAQDVSARLARFQHGATSEKKIGGETVIKKVESGEGLFFETWDSARVDGWIHRNYITK